MPRRLAFLSLLLMTMAQLPAFADGTLGEVLDKGGVQLKAEQLRALVEGSSIQLSVARGEFTFRPKANGELDGGFRLVTGESAQGQGNWAVRSDNRLCLKLTYSNGRSINGTYDRCGYWFQAGEQYWVSPSEAERGAPAFQYWLRK